MCRFIPCILLNTLGLLTRKKNIYFLQSMWFVLFLSSTSKSNGVFFLFFVSSISTLFLLLFLFALYCLFPSSKNIKNKETSTKAQKTSTAQVKTKKAKGIAQVGGNTEAFPREARRQQTKKNDK